jgi:hypothetical protein
LAIFILKMNYASRLVWVLSHGAGNSVDLSLSPEKIFVIANLTEAGGISGEVVEQSLYCRL